MLTTISFIRQPPLKYLWSQRFPRPIYVSHCDTGYRKGSVRPYGKSGKSKEVKNVCKKVRGGGKEIKSAGKEVKIVSKEVKSSCKAFKSGGKDDNSGGDEKALTAKLVRGDPPKVRLAFLPECWFNFMQQKTGVSGPYILAFVVANYCLSKEIYVLEHEYYSGLSWLVIFAVLYNKFGNTIGTALDKQVEAVSKEWENSREQDKKFYSDMIKDAKDAQWRAEGQKLLMDAKKENLLMQLEAAYRERAMLAYSTVVGRMDYHVKRYTTETRIQQKWMINWILQNVHKAITPDFQKRALESAIEELANLANKAK